MFESKINRGRANGYAPLGSSGKVPLDYLPPIQSTLNTGSFATTGSNTFTGVQTLAGTSGTAWAELTIGQTNIFGNYNSYDIRATGSSAAGISLTSDVVSVVGVIDKEFGPAGNNSVVFSGKYGFPYSDGPFTGIGVQQSGSQQKAWIYDYTGKASFPGDVNIGYTGFVAGEYSGSLNVNKGNINLSGSLNIESPAPPTLSIGSNYGGGKVAYIMTASDAGYDSNYIKGVIAAEFDQASSTNWDDSNMICGNLVSGGFDDWRLPTLNELTKLYTNRIAIGSFDLTDAYWSSTELGGGAYLVNFSDGGSVSVDPKYNTAMATRAVRSFSVATANALNINGNQTLTGSLKVSGSVKLSTTNGSGDSLDLIIGQTNALGPHAYQINASGSTENALFLISNLASVMAAQGTVSNPGDTSLFTTQVVGYVNNGGPEAQLQLSKSGSVPAIWVYDYTATSDFPGNINIGYDNIIGTTSGSLNIRNGNINLSGSINVSSSLTASLREGYVWVGDNTGKSTLQIATSSFGVAGGSGTSGTSGVSGTSGTSGTSGVNGRNTDLFPYNARTNITSGNPGNTNIIWNNATQTSATQLNISHLDRDNIDIDVFLALIPTGTIVIIQDANDSANYQRWTFGAGTEAAPNSYWTFPATYIDGGHSFTGGENILLIIAQTPSGTSGTSGVSGSSGTSGTSGTSGSSGFSINSGSFATTGSNQFNGNQQITGSLIVSASTNLTGSVTINESRIDNAWTSYTPTWGAPTPPAIGNGTITGAYKVIGKTCFVRGRITMGSTTTYGSGDWSIGLPVAAINAYAIQIPASLLDGSGGTGWYNALMNGAVALNTISSQILANFPPSFGGSDAGSISSIFPFTWASGDALYFNGSYEIA